LTARIFGKCWVDKMKGTFLQNEDYSKKQKHEFRTFGIEPNQGDRTDLKGVMEKIRTHNISQEDIAGFYPSLWCQYGRRFESYRILLEKERNWKTDIRVWWGPAESGKSRAARKWLGSGKYDTVDYTQGGFFIGYKGSENIILDDFEGQASMEKKVFMNMADRYPLVVNVKGTERNWAPKRIAITSNTNPEGWYPSQKIACMRRLTKVVYTGGQTKQAEVVQGNTEPVPQKVRKTHQKRCLVSSRDV